MNRAESSDGAGDGVRYSTRGMTIEGTRDETRVGRRKQIQMGLEMVVVMRREMG